MNNKVIIANWKMKLSFNNSIKLAEQYKDKFSGFNSDVEVVVCPDFVALNGVKNVFKRSVLGLGAQNISAYSKGAFTGDIPGQSLSEVGCNYTIIGHSERRNIFKESNEDVNKKLKLAIENDLIPVLCIGENIKCREDGEVKEFLKSQLDSAFSGIDFNDEQCCKEIIIAYEPIWAIGTGNIIKKDDIVEINTYIKSVLQGFFGDKKLENKFKVIYGGSVDSENAVNFIDELDGFLVGGSSLDANEFFKIVELV